MKANIIRIFLRAKYTLLSVYRVEHCLQIFDQLNQIFLDWYAIFSQFFRNFFAFFLWIEIFFGQNTFIEKKFRQNFFIKNFSVRIWVLPFNSVIAIEWQIYIFVITNTFVEITRCSKAFCCIFSTNRFSCDFPTVCEPNFTAIFNIVENTQQSDLMKNYTNFPLNSRLRGLTLPNKNGRLPVNLLHILKPNDKMSQRLGTRVFFNQMANVFTNGTCYVANVIAHTKTHFQRQNLIYEFTELTHPNFSPKCVDFVAKTFCIEFISFCLFLLTLFFPRFIILRKNFFLL